MIRALIFDLDNCLASSKEPGEDLFAPAFEAIRAANDGSVPEDRLQAAFSDCWRWALDKVAERYEFTPAMRDAGWEAFARIEVRKPMRGYGDLEVLGQLGRPLFLVTSGFRRLQESKIRALNLSRWFQHTIVDAIDEPGRQGKAGRFRQILQEQRWQPEEVLVIGDDAESEIAAAGALGIPSLQILRPGVPRGDNASAWIERLDELPPLLARYERSLS